MSRSIPVHAADASLYHPLVPIVAAVLLGPAAILPFAVRDAQATDTPVAPLVVGVALLELVAFVAYLAGMAYISWPITLAGAAFLVRQQPARQIWRTAAPEMRALPGFMDATTAVGAWVLTALTKVVLLFAIAAVAVALGL